MHPITTIGLDSGNLFFRCMVSTSAFSKRCFIGWHFRGSLVVCLIPTALSFVNYRALLRVTSAVRR
jgi:hypothetical protein